MAVPQPPGSSLLHSHQPQRLLQPPLPHLVLKTSCIGNLLGTAQVIDGAKLTRRGLQRVRGEREDQWRL